MSSILVSTLALGWALILTCAALLMVSPWSRDVARVAVAAREGSSQPIQTVDVTPLDWIR